LRYLHYFQDSLQIHNFIFVKLLNRYRCFFNDVVQDFAELTREMNNNGITPYYGKLALQIASPSGSQLPFLLNVIGFDSGSDHMVFSNGAEEEIT